MQKQKMKKLRWNEIEIQLLCIFSLFLFRLRAKNELSI